MFYFISRSVKKQTIQAYCLNVSAPELQLSMDIAVNGLLLGDISGTLHGGASTIPGKFGSALHISGNHQYVDYGLHLDKCYHNPDKCSCGITVALWLNVHAYGSVILDTGATHAQAFGYYILINSDHSIKISVKDTPMYHQYQAPEFPLNEWVHLVFTWPSNAGLIHLYINGCDADATNRKRYAYNLARYTSITRQSRITLGAGPDTPISYRYANADVDELVFWERVLDPLEAWQLYVDGGVVHDEWKHCTCSIQSVVELCQISSDILTKFIWSAKCIRNHYQLKKKIWKFSIVAM